MTIRGRGMREKEMGGEKWEGVMKGERERKRRERDISIIMCTHFVFVECVGGWACLCVGVFMCAASGSPTTIHPRFARGGSRCHTAYGELNLQLPQSHDFVCDNK